jgi:predicted Mrr-cat superfamily restriction endonuclease
MPMFTTISPTHVKGQKRSAWERFRDGHYVAIGWLNDIDLTGKPINEITDLIHQRNYDNEAAAIQSFERFFSLRYGDYVAVNNTNAGLFGVGRIKSEYRFDLKKHDCGDPGSSEPFYPHYRDVDWVTTEYVRRSSLVTEGETSWQPYGTVGKVYPELPPYILRLIGEPIPKGGKIEYVRPPELEVVIQAVEALRKEREHKERAHESLVEEFFVALGYEKHTEIKYRQGRVDVAIEAAGNTLLVVEVKAVWDLSSRNGRDAIKQAYNYAHEQGVRYVVVTNGNDYMLFDRLRGLSWENNLLGEFQLTTLDHEDLATIERLRPARLKFPDPGEAFRHIAKSFESTRSTGMPR